MILGIESSCDESALALFDPDKGILADLVHSQIEMHKDYGGVVPNLASRAHLTNFPTLLEKILEFAKDRKPEKIAVTCGPGLAGCLALGVALAKSLGLAWQASVVGVNHLRGHSFSPFIGLHAEDPESFNKRLRELFPHLGLIVSGGNTILFSIDVNQGIKILGQTVDDAAGEALDKGAKLLGLGYPGGPLIEKIGVNGNANAFDFPRAFQNSSDLKYSFSGLKTSLRYRLEKMDDSTLEDSMPDICASFQEAVVAALTGKLSKALTLAKYKSIGLSGGVSNNKRLRSAVESIAEEKRIPCLIAKPKYTGDNAGMIAFAAYVDPRGLKTAGESGLSFYPSWALA